MITNVIRITSLTLLLILVSGCATALVTGQNHATSTHKITTHVISDEIVAIARPKQGELQTNNDYPDGLVMIGLSNSYHITNGGEFIENLTNLDAAAISINDNQDIDFVINGTKFFGLISVNYIKEQYTDEDLALLKTLKFTSHIKKIEDKSYAVYTAKMRVAGNIYTKYQGNEIASLSKGRKVKFSTEKYETKLKGETLVELPFAIAFDVATAPIQAILFIGIVAAVNQHPR